jgi:hypothetical protein
MVVLSEIRIPEDNMQRYCGDGNLIGSVALPGAGDRDSTVVLLVSFRNFDFQLWCFTCLDFLEVPPIC